MRKYLVLCTVLVGSLCSVPAISRGVAEQDLEGMKKLAVVVSLGDTMHAVFLGTTAFQNKAFDVPVAEWQINKLATDAIIETLKQRGKVAAEPLVMEEGRLDSLYGKHVSGPLSRPAFKVFVDHAKAQGADAVLVLERTTSENQPFHQSGFGLFRHQMFGMVAACPYVLFRAEVDRVSDGKVLAGQFDAPCEMGQQKFEARKSWDQYSDEERKAFESALKEEIINKVNLALDELQLLK